jgi:hypothetical protein
MHTATRESEGPHVHHQAFLAKGGHHCDRAKQSDERHRPARQQNNRKRTEKEHNKSEETTHAEKEDTRTETKR